MSESQTKNNRMLAIGLALGAAAALAYACFTREWLVNGSRYESYGFGLRTNYMFEGNTMLGALAARTSKVSVGLLVGGVMYRNPALLAKLTTTLDIISLYALLASSCAS